MAFKDFLNKEANELQGLLSEARGELHDLKFRHSIGQLKSVDALRDVKTRIAHILTALNAKR